MSAVERFGGKVALITGGGTGIGAAIAELLASEGAKVAICGRRAEVIQRRADQLTAAGYTIHAIVGDVSTDAGAIVQETVETFGRLDILVNNAEDRKSTRLNSSH